MPKSSVFQTLFLHVQLGDDHSNRQSAPIASLPIQFKCQSCMLTACWSHLSLLRNPLCISRSPQTQVCMTGCYLHTLEVIVEAFLTVVARHHYHALVRASVAKRRIFITKPCEKSKLSHVDSDVALQQQCVESKLKLRWLK